MKKAIKTVWSCWNKTDRIVAIISIIALSLILCCGCNAQPQRIPTQEYNDCEEPENTIEQHTIMFMFYGVIDFNYNPVTNLYTIEYDDEDAFDYDVLSYKGEDWYGDFIILNVTKENFFEMLTDFNKSSEEKLNIEFSEKWQIKEVKTVEDDIVSYDYYLIKNPNYK